MNPEQIKKLRGSLGLNQTQFALLVGVKRTTICAWENGHPPRPRNIAKLMELLNKKWVGLTDDEIEGITARVLTTLTQDVWPIALSRAIEDKLKEKNT